MMLKSDGWKVSGQVQEQQQQPTSQKSTSTTTKGKLLSSSISLCHGQSNLQINSKKYQWYQ